MKRHCCLILITLLVVCCKRSLPKVDSLDIVPKPMAVQENGKDFHCNNQVAVSYEENLSGVAAYLKETFESRHGIRLAQTSERVIVLKKQAQLKNEEAYTLEVSNDTILIASKTAQGVFYGVQTLLQMIPVNLEFGAEFLIPGVKIDDAPRFPYRGMHLDVGRHFYEVSFIKKYIDLIAELKMNTFHWHLTEDQGWRIEIKKYPKLQEVAAYRKETLVGHYSDQPHRFDGKRYGGYYTQEQIKDIVAYAQQRMVTIVPEIEMPGHSTAAIAAYPSLGCTGEQVTVARKWGVFEEVYCPKEETFKFLEDVIDEVAALFPGKYIHIGGDEAPKTRWKNCKHCQQLIREKGLHDVHGLQSYFITRMEKYINSKGKQIIGWDEILEGGLAPNATVMSWRGTAGAVKAAQQQHPVILTPTSNCYFDYYQSDNSDEPLAIGGFLPLKKVYEFDPIPKELKPEERTFVLGAQGNVWTEYMPTSKQVEYMAFPRAAALSEVVWSENKNYTDFTQRLETLQQRWKKRDLNFANHLYDVTGTLMRKSQQLHYKLQTTTNQRIYYTTDGDHVPEASFVPYSEPIPVNHSMTIKAQVVDTQGNKLGAIFEQKIDLHKGVGAVINIDKNPHPSYDAGGKEALINGISGSDKRYGDKEWLGFWGQDITVTITFEKPTPVKTLTTRFHNGNGQWIYAPKQIISRVEPKNGPSIRFETQVNLNSDANMIPVKVQLSEKEAILVKKIQLFVPNFGNIPTGQQGAGNKAWTFIDEIVLK